MWEGFGADEVGAVGAFFCNNFSAVLALRFSSRSDLDVVDDAPFFISK
jgi:hypothetical protein